MLPLRVTGWEEPTYFRVRLIRDSLLSPVSRGLHWIGIGPSAISLLGVGLAASLFWTLPSQPKWALFGLVAALTCDAVDGAVARLGSPVDRKFGKKLDHACDLTTFLVVLLALFKSDLTHAFGTVIAGILSLPLLLAGTYCHRQEQAQDPKLPVAGFFAHIHKLPVYGALVAYLLRGPDWISLAVSASAVTAACALALLIVAGRVSDKNSN